jgi:hypothetical protein
LLMAAIILFISSGIAPIIPNVIFLSLPLTPNGE